MVEGITGESSTNSDYLHFVAKEGTCDKHKEKLHGYLKTRSGKADPARKILKSACGESGESGGLRRSISVRSSFSRFCPGRRSRSAKNLPPRFSTLAPPSSPPPPPPAAPPKAPPLNPPKPPPKPSAPPPFSETRSVSYAAAAASSTTNTSVQLVSTSAVSEAMSGARPRTFRNGVELRRDFEASLGPPLGVPIKPKQPPSPYDQNECIKRRSHRIEVLLRGRCASLEKGSCDVCEEEEEDEAGIYVTAEGFESGYAETKF